jgi:HEAT repeats
VDSQEHDGWAAAAAATELGDKVASDPEEIWLSRFRDATLLVLAIVAHAHEASAREIRRGVGRQWPGALWLSLRSLRRAALVEREYRPGPDYWSATPAGTRLGVVPYVTRLLGAAVPLWRGFPAYGWSVGRFGRVGTTHGPPIFSPAYTLADLHDPEKLADVIRTGTRDDRAYAVTKLVALRDPSSVGILREVAKRRGDEELLAREAVVALGSFDTEASIAALIDVAADRDSVLREAAARSLGRLRSIDAVPTLVALIGFPSEPVRAAALRALARIGDRSAVAPVAGALDDPDGSVRRCARHALVALGAADQLKSGRARPWPLGGLDVRRARAVGENRARPGD